MGKSDILKVSALCKDYPSGDGRLRVIDDISFSISEGSTCSLVGPSGSGKTTLLGLCAGLDRPSSGTLTLLESRLDSLDEDQLAALRNRSVGFVFQSFQLIPTLTALENVLVPAELRGLSGARGRAMDLLSRVGLSERLEHYPSQLSGGEQQRVAIARAYINEPQILFADEPTGNLDAETGAAVQELLFDLNRTAGTTLLLATHNMELAEKTQRILRMKSGRFEEA